MVPPIGHDEYVATVRAHLRSWPKWLDAYTRRAAQGYAVITACRALHLCETEEAVSKQAAVRWALDRYPRHALFIEQASEQYFRPEAAIASDDDAFRSHMREFFEDVAPM